ncbi:unnamed protein product, partial [Hapterophycus canaliculatus]
SIATHRNLVKIQRRWDKHVNALKLEAADKVRETERKHRQQRRSLTKHIMSSRDTVKSTIPLNGRLATMRASRDNLVGLGRMEEAEKVRRKLAPLEQGFWAKVLAGTGVVQEAKQKKTKLLGVQQAEIGLLSSQLRRDIERAEHAKYTEVKAQQRKNRCSSEDVWSIWSAAKSGEAERLSYMLSLPRANVEARDPDSGWTALHFASRQGELATVSVLIENQAFVGGIAPDGRTPLHLAAGWGTYEVCFALLEAGADKTFEDNNGETSQHLAESRGRGRIAALLDGWRPIGLTATQTHKIKQSRGEGPLRPWETEADTAIRSQLRALDMKRCTFGIRHPGTRMTLGRLAGLCREAGRLEDAKGHLQSLVELLQDISRAGGGERGTPNNRKSCTFVAAPRDELAALAAALGNLGVVHRELGDGEQASNILKKALETASSIEYDSTSGDTGQEYLVNAATRNLGLHYLSEGRVEEAQPLLQASFQGYEQTLRSDMAGGDESLELIPLLTVLSYADMLAGEHATAAEKSTRAQAIAANYRKHGDEINSPFPQAVLEHLELSDPIPRLEWLGVQRFVERDNSSALRFFAQARALLVLQLRKQALPESKWDLAAANASGNGNKLDWMGRNKEQVMVSTDVPVEEITTVKALYKEFGSAGLAQAVSGEFHPDAMRLDRCMAVAICRQGPEAF